MSRLVPVRGHTTIQEHVAARLTDPRHISRDISVRQNGWIGGPAGGWQWQVELISRYGQMEATLSPRQARTLAKTLLRFADECDRKNSEARHAD